MASGSTARLGLPYPLGTDPTNIPGDFGPVNGTGLQGTLDGLVAAFGQGTAAGRPSPTIVGRWYYATDTGVFSYDTGSAWVDSANTSPIGTVIDFAGPSSNLPTNYLLCNGQAVSRTTYAALYNALGAGGSPWGQGNFTTTFNVPDFRGRVPVGSGTAASSTVYAVGDTGGQETHILTQAELPAANTTNESVQHHHASPSPATGFVVAVPSSSLYLSTTSSPTPVSITSNTDVESVGHVHGTGGSNTPHNTMQPFAVTTKAIRAL